MSNDKNKSSGINIFRPRGTRDFMPADIVLRRRVEQKIRENFELFGFQEIQTPLFETMNLFEIRSGEKFRDDVYRFVGPTKEQKEGDLPIEYCLRPELTAPTCRFFTTGDLGHIPKPLKIYYMGPCFRYDTPAPGRYREFYQAGIELFGSTSVKSDAEVVTVAASVIKSLGIPDFRIQINDLSILRNFLTDLGLDKDKQAKVVSAIDNAGSDVAKFRLGALEETSEEIIKEEFTTILSDIIDNPIIDLLSKLLELKGGTEVLDQALELFKDYPSTIEAINKSGMNAVFTMLDINKIENVVLDLSIARGLDYYTGLVFEIDVDKLGAQKQVCGGGRYDRLVSEYGGTDTPATGFAFGIDRLINCVEIFKTDVFPTGRDLSRSDVLIKSMIDDFSIEAKLSTAIRNSGIRVETELTKRNMKKTFQNASKMGIKFVIILGKRELENNSITIKNMMAETQETIEFNEEIIVNYLKEKL